MSYTTILGKIYSDYEGLYVYYIVEAQPTIKYIL